MPDTRWQPSCDRAALAARSAFYRTIREFFYARDVLEVDTPLLGNAPVSDPNIEPMQTREGRWLHTSPEYAMKRLLCAGSGDIWQLCKVFRAGEAGRRHNPEFSMLEWYRVSWSLDRLMGEVRDLVRALFQTRTHPYTRKLFAASTHTPERAETAETAPLLRVENVVRDYRLPKRRLFGPAPSFRAVNDVSFQVNAGESVGLVGESGCGKSTLTRAILGLEPVQSGQISLADTAVTPAMRAETRTQMQVVFQDPYGSLSPRMTCEKIITEGSY